MHWVALFVAVVANIAANASLKFSVNAVTGATTGQKIISLATQPYFWLGLGSAAILLAAYLVAIRGLQLSVAYTVVAGSAMAGLAVADMLLFQASLPAPALAGIALVVAGIALISYAG